MRLAVVWHGAVVRTGRAFLRELAARPDVQPVLIAPTRWSGALPRPLAYEPAEEPFPVRLYRPVFSGHGAALFAPRIGRLLNQAAPDVLLAIEEPFSVLMGQIAAWKRRTRSAPFLACFSYQNLEKRYPFPFNAIERRAFRSLDLLLGASPEVLEVARRKGCTAPGVVMATPVDVEFYADIARRRPGGASGSELRVGYVGRFVEEKGIDVLLEAIGGMRHPARLVLVGSGPEEERLRRMAAPLRDRVRFAGPLSAEEVARTYADLDVLVLPSRTRPHWKEQFGRVLVEAMAAGVAVIASDSGAIPWVIGDAGLLFREGDPPELAAALDRLAGSSQLREDLVRKGRERAAREFSARVVADRLYEVLSSPRPPQPT